MTKLAIVRDGVVVAVVKQKSTRKADGDGTYPLADKAEVDEGWLYDATTTIFSPPEGS